MKSLFLLFVFKYLALWSQGHLGYVGLGKETTWGTGVAATDYFEIMSENVSLAINRFPTRNAFGGFYEPDDSAGARLVGGDLSMASFPVPIGHWLKAAFNTHSITSILSGFLWRNNFSTVKSDFADGVPSQPYTLEIHRDTGSSYRYAGMVANRLQLSLAPNNALMATMGVLAKAPSIIAKTTPTFVGSSTEPFTWDSASLSLGGSSTARIEALNLSINNNIDNILALNNTSQPARFRRRGPQEARIGGTLDFIDQAEYDDFVNQTERRLFLNLFRSQSFNVIMDAPRFVYETFPTGIPGRDRLTVGFSGIARYSTLSGLAVDIGLTTTKSNY